MSENRKFLTSIRSLKGPAGRDAIACLYVDGEVIREYFAIPHPIWHSAGLNEISGIAGTIYALPDHPPGRDHPSGFVVDLFVGHTMPKSGVWTILDSLRELESLPPIPPGAYQTWAARCDATELWEKLGAVVDGIFGPGAFRDYVGHVQTQEFGQIDLDLDIIPHLGGVLMSSSYMADGTNELSEARPAVNSSRTMAALSIKGLPEANIQLLEKYFDWQANQEMRYAPTKINDYPAWFPDAESLRNKAARRARLTGDSDNESLTHVLETGFVMKDEWIIRCERAYAISSIEHPTRHWSQWSEEVSSVLETLGVHGLSPHQPFAIYVSGPAFLRASVATWIRDYERSTRSDEFGFDMDGFDGKLRALSTIVNRSELLQQLQIRVANGLIDSYGKSLVFAETSSSGLSIIAVVGTW